MKEKSIEVKQQTDEFGKCERCGSRRVWISATEIHILYADLGEEAAMTAHTLSYDREFGVPECGMCGAEREDLTPDQIDEIYQWAC